MSDNSVSSFVTRNKTAILATAAAGGAAIGAYYYYNQLQRAESGSGSGSSGSKKTSKSEKKKRAGKKKKDSSSSPSGSDVVYPVDANGQPDLSKKDEFTPEQVEKYALALKDKGNEFFKAKDFEKAIEYYTLAISLKEDPVFYSNRSAAYVSINNFEKVVEDTTAALKLKPDYSKCWLRRASAYENLGQFSDAMFDLSAVSLLGEYSGQSVEQLLERNMNKQATKVLGEKLKENQGKESPLPSNTSLASFFGIFNPETSFDDYDGENEADVELKKGLENLYKCQTGCYELADEEFTKAAELYKKELESSPDNESLKKKAAIAFEHVGIFKFFKNDPITAHINLEESLSLNPRPSTYIYMALIMADKGEANQYKEYFDKALELDPNCSAVYYHRGQMHFVVENFKEAGADFDKAKELNPENIFAYIQCACLAFRDDRFDDCETLFSEARRKFPTAPEVPNFYAEILAAKNSLDAAIKQYDIAIKLEDALPGIHVGIAPMIGKATALIRNPTVENFVEASELFEEACKIDPRSEQAKIGLAQLKLQQEEIDDAIQLFEDAADLSRSFDEKLQATTFAEATKVQKKIRADPFIKGKIDEAIAAYRAQGIV
ncbi:Tom71/Tom70 [Kluyveromyces lactis]|nr:Tom71/Tom70 [Kluyveromyces lactis]